MLQQTEERQQRMTVLAESAKRNTTYVRELWYIIDHIEFGFTKPLSNNDHVKKSATAVLRHMVDSYNKAIADDQRRLQTLENITKGTA